MSSHREESQNAAIVSKWPEFLSAQLCVSRGDCMFPWKSVFLTFHREDVLLTISPVFTQREPWSQPEAVDCSSVPGSMYLTFRSQLPCRCWVFKVCVCFCFFLFISKGIALDSAGISLTAL